MIPKKIAILGDGHGGHMMAADMALKGHTVNMYIYQEREEVRKLMDTKTIESCVELKGFAKLNKVTTDIDEAIEGCRYICIVTPAFAHGYYAKLLKGRVKKDQIIVTFPGAFAALQLREAFGGDMEDLPVFADANNLPYDARISGPAKVSLFGRNDINIAYLPVSAGPALYDEMCEDLFPFKKIYNDVLECGLSIVNPAWHTGPCLFSVSAIERPTENFFVYEHGWTPSACKLNIVLNNERRAIGKVLGYNLRPMEDFSGMPEGFDWKQLYAAGHGSISLTPICGPNSIFDRYLTEDCPFGLVPWADIAKLLGVEMPITNGVIDIYNIIHETDWRATGLTNKDLGIEGMTKEQLVKYITTGEK